MAKPFPRGRFVWYELMTTDPDAAIAFYRKAFGWGVTPFPEDPTYRIWTVETNPVGGVMRLPEDARRMGTPPNWLPYIGVPSVDATVRQATGLGAKTYVQPRDIPRMGRFAVLADPQGAAFAVFQPAMGTPPPDATPKRGEFAWHELATSDWRAAWEFYRALFGWQKTEAMDMGPAGTYHMFGNGGPSVGGMYNKAPEMPAPPHWLCYVSVTKADDAATSVTKLGGKIVNGPMEVPGGGRIAMCVDPQGAAFAVYSTPAPATKSRAAKPKSGAAKAKSRAAKAKSRAAKAKSRAAKPKKRPKQKAKPKRRAKAAKRWA